MFDRILELVDQGKIFSFSPFGDKSDISSTGQVLREIVGGMPGMVPFDISSVADFLYKEAKQHFEERGTHLPTEDTFRGELLRLPYDLCWFEFVLAHRRSGPQRVGVVATPVESSASKCDFCMTPVLLDTQDGGLTFLLLGGDANVFAVLDEDGLYQHSLMSPEMNALKAGQPEVYTALNSCVGITLYTIYLLHWKKDVQIIPQRPSRQQQRRARQTNRKPPVEYKTINIGRWVKKYRSVIQGVEGGFQQRWHQVRGHKTTWTEAAPQFGCEECKRTGVGHSPENTKSHVGTFWIEPHHAGRKELGEIKHVYTVDPPK
jgi:hypothetical protein